MEVDFVSNSGEGDPGSLYLYPNNMVAAPQKTGFSVFKPPPRQQQQCYPDERRGSLLQQQHHHHQQQQYYDSPLQPQGARNLGNNYNNGNVRGFPVRLQEDSHQMFRELTNTSGGASQQRGSSRGGEGGVYMNASTVPGMYNNNNDNNLQRQQQQPSFSEYSHF